MQGTLCLEPGRCGKKSPSFHAIGTCARYARSHEVSSRYGGAATGLSAVARCSRARKSCSEYRHPLLHRVLAPGDAGCSTPSALRPSAQRHHLALRIDAAAIAACACACEDSGSSNHLALGDEPLGGRTRPWSGRNHGCFWPRLRSSLRRVGIFGPDAAAAPLNDYRHPPSTPVQEAPGAAAFRPRRRRG